MPSPMDFVLAEKSQEAFVYRYNQ